MSLQFDVTVAFPSISSVVRLDTLVKMSNKARAYHDRKLLFDLSEVKQLSPIFLCILAATVSDCARDLGNSVVIKLPKSRRAADILRKVNFISETGGRIESQFLQVRRLTQNDIFSIRDIVELIAFNLRISDGVKEMMRVILSELFQNAIDHSGRNSCYVCAGVWGKSSHVHISIVDFGVGIPSRLRTKYGRDVGKNDSRAIELVLKEGITTRERRVGGLGYSFIQSFLRANKGRLRIYTGKSKADYNFMRSEYNIGGKREFFSGTCVDIQINKDRKNYYQLLGENTEHYF